MRDGLISWQKVLAQGFSSAAQLLEYLQIPELAGSRQAEQQFKTRVPRSFAERMQPGNPHDPLLLQVLAQADELTSFSNYSVDPLNEAATNVLPGLIHKYQGRVLLTVTGVCAINCRYCFRRHFPYQENNLVKDNLTAIINYIANNTTIHEVILSGGDPLLAVDKTLANLLNQLDKIPHLRTLRLHTRVPIVLPERINQSLLAILAATRLRKVMVIHCNHAQEINEQVRNVCTDLRHAGYNLLNQSVLLRGINDCDNILAALSEALFDCQVLPYYLHVMDKVAGTQHFDLAIDKALAIYHRLQQRLPGYLVPRLTKEEAGKGSKTLLV